MRTPPPFEALSMPRSNICPVSTRHAGALFSLSRILHLTSSPPTARDGRGTLPPPSPTRVSGCRHLPIAAATFSTPPCLQKNKTPPSCVGVCRVCFMGDGRTARSARQCCHDPCLGPRRMAASLDMQPAAGGMALPTAGKHKNQGISQASFAAGRWEEVRGLNCFGRWPMAHNAELPDAWHGGGLHAPLPVTPTTRVSAPDSAAASRRGARIHSARSTPIKY